MLEEVIRETDTRMKKALEAVKRDFAAIRTGRATPSLVENYKVDYYGVPTPLSQMATIFCPEAQLIVIQPWDKSALGSIEKTILKSSLGINPVNDGTVLRLNLPPLSGERRAELAKSVRKRAEESRIAIRSVRHEMLEGLQKKEKNKEISQDELKMGENKIQKLVDLHIEEVNKLTQAKEKELMED